MQSRAHSNGDIELLGTRQFRAVLLVMVMDPVCLNVCNGPDHLKRTVSLCFSVCGEEQRRKSGELR